MKLFKQVFINLFNVHFSILMKWNADKQVVTFYQMVFGESSNIA